VAGVRHRHKPGGGIVLLEATVRGTADPSPVMIKVGAVIVFIRSTSSGDPCASGRHDRERRSLLNARQAGRQLLNRAIRALKLNVRAVA
jgi:hypothetical protein